METIGKHGKALVSMVALITLIYTSTYGYVAVNAGKPPPQPPFPNPVLLRHIDLSSYAGSNDFFRSNIQFGDLNNDGIYTDILRYANSKRMQAFAYSGGTSVTLLWDYTAPVSLPNPPTDYHYKYAIWDVDNDGKTEVIGPFASSSGYVELRILDGATGTVERSITTSMPNPTSDDNILEWRIYVTVANFRGLAKPQDIVLLNEKNSYGDIWVYDNALNILWDTTGDNSAKQRIYAHFPYTGDIDNDGKDELIGTWVFDHNGVKLWRITPPEWEPYDYFYDHIDRGFIGNMDPDRSGLEILACHEYMRAKLYDTSGNLYWSSPGSGDSKITAVGEMTSTYVGDELCIWDTAYKGKTHIFDIDGTDRKTITRVLDGYPVDWDGNRARDEIFSPNGGILYSPWDGYRLFLNNWYSTQWFTSPGANQIIWAHALDIVGDYREDVVIADEDEFMIYGAEGSAPGSYPSPWSVLIYRLAMANKQDDMHPERMWFDWSTL